MQASCKPILPLRAEKPCSTTTQIRLWSHDNFGENLLINPRDSGVFYWQKTTGTGARAVRAKDMVRLRNQVAVVDVAASKRPLMLLSRLLNWLTVTDASPNDANDASSPASHDAPAPMAKGHGPTGSAGARSPSHIRARRRCRWPAYGMQARD